MTPPWMRLRRRLDASIDRQNSRVAMNADTLLEAAEVLASAIASHDLSTVDVKAVDTVALLHIIRNYALESAGDHEAAHAELQAAASLYVLLHVISPDLVAPKVRDLVADLTTPKPPPCAALIPGVGSQSVAIHWAWRAGGDRRLLDACITARRLAITFAPSSLPTARPPTHPQAPGRHSSRFGIGRSMPRAA